MSMFASLCRANQGILNHKVLLMKVFGSKYGEERAREIFRTICPIVHASVGQHFRHSIDHIERAVLAASSPNQRQIHYDFRERHVPEESDWDLAYLRIQRVERVLDELASSASHIPILDHPVTAGFMLSGDNEQEFQLPSTVARELGFAAHHAIHHLAMVKVIATTTVGGLEDAELPMDFGRAPSTVNFDRMATAAAEQ